MLRAVRDHLEEGEASSRRVAASPEAAEHARPNVWPCGAVVCRTMLCGTMRWNPVFVEMSIRILVGRGRWNREGITVQQFRKPHGGGRTASPYSRTDSPWQEEYEKTAPRVCQWDSPRVEVSWRRRLCELGWEVTGQWAKAPTHLSPTFISSLLSPSILPLSFHSSPLHLSSL